MLKKAFFAFTVLTILSLLLGGGTTATGSASIPVSLEGTFSVRWGDGKPGTGESRMAYFLSTAQNGSVRIYVSENLLASLGGIMALNQREVTAQGNWWNEGTAFNVQYLALNAGKPARPQGIFGPQPWVSILCKFSDYPDEPKDLTYFNGMYSADYPGLDHYWQQQSYSLANLQGSGAFGWFVLPDPRADYLPGGNLDWDHAAKDCTAAADPVVNFRNYVGINMMFNALLDCCAWGGGWYGCLDGLCQTWRMTWEPPWGYENIGVIAHETGHCFGLPHSLGNCRQGYDNRWDVLSDIWSNGADPNYGTMGQHTIGYHKQMLEWINSGQSFVASTGTINTITLERLALPQTNNYLAARILINNKQDFFYTLEVRQPDSNLINYDKWLPGFAVIIHEVATNRPEPATVIDQDGNCTTGDEGAMYKTGETFKDATNGISVSIDAATDSGYIVTINNRFTPMTGVDLSAPVQGYLGDTLPFTATVSPSGATTPITYTWQATDLPPVVHMDGTTDVAKFAWESAGTKAITVTASNDGGSVVDTHLIQIQPKIPLVTLNSPDFASVGVPVEIGASVLPADVLLPITYTWQASGQGVITHTAGITDGMSYQWNEPGSVVITVTASNDLGSSSDSLTLPVAMPPGSLQVDGPTEGDLQYETILTATVQPITTTVPISYSWMVDNQLPIVHSSGITDSLTIQWQNPGLHRITVTAANLAGSAQAQWEVMVFFRVYLPIGLRN